MSASFSQKTCHFTLEAALHKTQSVEALRHEGSAQTKYVCV